MARNSPILQHLREWHESVPLGTVATPSEIAAFKSLTYLKGAPVGGVTSRLFPSNRDKIPAGFEAVQGESPKVRVVRMTDDEYLESAYEEDIVPEEVTEDPYEDAVPRFIPIPDQKGKTDQELIHGALDLAWEQSDRMTGVAPEPVIEELLFNLVPIISRASLQGVRAYIEMALLEATKESWSIPYSAFLHQALSKLSYTANPRSVFDDLDEGDEDEVPREKVYEIAHSQAFYVRVCLGHALRDMAESVKAMRAASEDENLMAIWQESLKGGARWQQQVLGESVQAFATLPDELKPDLKPYAQVTPFGPLAFPADTTSTEG